MNINHQMGQMGRQFATGALFACVALFTAACGSDETSTPTEDDAVLVGQMQGALHSGEPRLRVNGDPRDIQVDEDRRFAVRDVPTGDVTIEFETEDASGTVTVTDVQAGEVIDVSVGTDDQGRLNIRIERRAQRDLGERPDDRRADLIYNAKDTVHQLRPGVYEGNLVIDAKNVSIFGARDRDCDGEGATVIDGDLIINHKDARVVDVVVLGRTVIAPSAMNTQILDTCAHAAANADDDSDSDS